MAKVKIDFKAKGQVILNYFKEKGEKVGLGVCLAIMLLLVVWDYGAASLHPARLRMPKI